MNDTHGTEIILNVYLLGDASQPQVKRSHALSAVGLGLYHSGVEINGFEY